MKAFEEHFADGKHLWGLISLGVPRKACDGFRGLSSVAEVIALLKTMGQRSMHSSFTDTHEQCEDNSGHVMSKKSYFDLKRQGLV